jgi:glycosyltransferase involved in cell wall biosynthesis
LLPGGINADRLRAFGIRVSDLGMSRGWPHPLGLWRLIRHVQRFRPDVLQSWLYHADLLALLANMLTHRGALFWNVRCSRLAPEDHGRLLFLAMGVLAGFSGYPVAIVANAAAGREFHAGRGYRPRAWEIIPNALDTDMFRPCEAARQAVRKSLGLPSSARLVGLVARYHPMKDHATFLRAAARVSAGMPDVHFALVGAGADRENPILASQLRESGIANRVHLLGAREDMSLLQAAWDVAVSSSYSEGFPNALGEAMCCAVPCVSTDVGDVRLLLGDTGAILPPRQADALSVALAQLLGLEEGERKALGSRARQRVMAMFSVEMAVDRYLDLYQRQSTGGASLR